MCVRSERSWCCDLAAGCLQGPDLEQDEVAFQRSQWAGIVEAIAKDTRSLEEIAASHVRTEAELEAKILNSLPPGTLCLS